MRIANNRRNKSIKKNATERVLSVDEVPFIFMKKSRKKNYSRMVSILSQI